ncbi:tape measure protein, partial [Ancylobacter radicis]
MALDSNRLTVAIEGRITSLEKAMARADAVTSRTYNRMSQGAARTSVRIEKSMGQVSERTSTAMIALSRTAASSLAAAISVQKIAGAAAVYTDLANTLKVAGLEGAALQGTFRDLFDIAQRNGTAIEPLVTLYSRLSQAQGELGASAEDLTRFTDGIALALRVGGTSAEAASGALMQLSQAMGGAVVRAEEFNSINEGARPILQAVADGLEEAGGSVSKLRNLVVEGKLSSEAFFRAFLAGMPNLERQSAKATGTVSQGLTRVNNALINLVGKLDEATGASAQAAENLGSVASSIESMPDFISRAVQKLGSLRSALAEIGNASVWRKLGEFMGIDYSPEGLRKRAQAYGYNPPAADTPRAGSSRRGGAVMAPQPVSTVSIADAPVEGAGKTSRERQNDYERLTQMIQQRTAALNAETAAQAGINPLLDD